eukprot:389983-Rhodomonas_salina.1
MRDNVRRGVLTCASGAGAGVRQLLQANAVAGRGFQGRRAEVRPLRRDDAMSKCDERMRCLRVSGVRWLLWLCPR